MFRAIPLLLFPMILYAVIADTSVVKLFVAGIVPGIIVGLALMGVAYWHAVRLGLPSEAAFHLANVWRSFREAGLALLLPVIILGGIFGGLARHLLLAGSRPRSPEELHRAVATAFSCELAEPERPLLLLISVLRYSFRRNPSFLEQVFDDKWRALTISARRLQTGTEILVSGRSFGHSPPRCIKGKPVERRGRKATGLQRGAMTAGLPAKRKLRFEEACRVFRSASRPRAVRGAEGVLHLARGAWRPRRSRWTWRSTSPGHPSPTVARPMLAAAPPTPEVAA